jgi:16S rRNA (cytosine967-C5)-methyltransferase
MAISPARSVAFEILRRVEAGGYASDLLLSRSGRLESRDAGLASEIVLGSLRFQSQLDFLIGHFAGRDPARLDPEVGIVLRMGIYQLRYLNRIPAHAAVGESVELVKRARKRSAAGFVNAALRKVHRDPVPFPGRATELSHPGWLLESWDRQFGAEAAAAIARANLSAPESYVRIPAGVDVPPGLVLEPAELPGSFRVLKGDPKGLRVQDIGSQSVVPLLELEPGQSFLDVCAAPGNKTVQALEYGIRAVACDLHWSRLSPMRNLGCSLVVVDASLSLPFSARFDRILVDAPCSGTGTLARNPEIKWRLRPGDLDRLHEMQAALLRNALERLAPGGRLVYSTCSLERAENEAVVEEILKAPDARAQLRRIWRRLPGIDPGDGFFAAVLTSD